MASAAPVATPDAVDLLNRVLETRLCLEPGASPVRDVRCLSLYYDHEALPLRTAAGTGCRAGGAVDAAALDGALPESVQAAFPGTFEGVALASRRAEWPDDGAWSFAARTGFPGRSGDFLHNLS